MGYAACASKVELGLMAGVPLQLEGGFVYFVQSLVVGRFPVLQTECWRVKRESLNRRLTLVIVLPAAAGATYKVCVAMPVNLKTLIMTSSFHLRHKPNMSRSSSA